jgi:hypothetical protein
MYVLCDGILWTTFNRAIADIKRGRSRMINGFNTQFKASTGKWTFNAPYTVIVEDIEIRPKVVAPCKALKGLKPSIIGKELGELNDIAIQKVIDYPAEMSSKGNEQPKVRDVVRIVFSEPTTGKRFIYDSTPNFNFAYYDDSWQDSEKRNVPEGKPSKDFFEFVERATKFVIEAGQTFTLGDIFKKGDKFTAIIIKDDNGYPMIDKDTVMPFGVVSTSTKVEAAKSGVTNIELSGAAQDLYKLIQSKAEELKGRPVGDLVNTLLAEWTQNGAMSGDWSSGFAAWQEVKRAHPEIVGADETFAL